MSTQGHDPKVLKSLEFLRAPAVLKTIHQELLRGGWPRHEIDDGVSHVVAGLTEYVLEEKLVVESEDRMRAIARKPAHDAGVDHKRYNGRRVNISVRPKNEEQAPAMNADANEASGLTAEQRLHIHGAAAILDQHTTDAERPLAESLARGETRKEYAARANISHDTARRQAGDLRSKYRRVLEATGYGKIGGGVGLIVGAFALWYVFIHKPLPDEQGAKKELTPAPSAQIAPPEQVPVSALPPQLTREQVDHIAELLDKAHLNHNQRRWAACNAAYQAVMDQYAPAVVDNPVEAEMADLCQQITFSAK